MKRADILKEIESVDTTKYLDGLSFGEHYNQTKHITAIEELLLFCNSPKYYYNYSEKRLRKLKTHDENIKNLADGDDIIFICQDLNKEPDIKIDSLQFSNKIICYEDYHKVITYDDSTKHYECFYVNLSKKGVEKFFKDCHEKLPEDKKQFFYFPQEEEKDAYKDLADSFKTISDYLESVSDDISEIRFINTADGVQIDVVTSRLYKPDLSD